MSGIPRADDARLQLWTIYDRPRDYPWVFVGRFGETNVAKSNHACWPQIFSG
jgi:hypothetical protein